MANLCTLAKINCHYCRDGLCQYGMVSFWGDKEQAVEYCNCAQRNAINSNSCTPGMFKEIQVKYMAQMLAAMRQNQQNQK